jgi:poly-gamma-glutamate biosynthesis protein PgsC/CapC
MPGFETAVIGLIASLAFIWLTGVYPGGIIVPSYLALFLHEPERLIGTLLAALVTVGVYRLASRWLILFGRRRFAFLVLAGGVLALLWLQFLPRLFPASVEYRVIGWVIPGLIANQLDRQGVTVTTASLVTVTVAVGWLARLLPLS